MRLTHRSRSTAGLAAVVLIATAIPAFGQAPAATTLTDWETEWTVVTAAGTATSINGSVTDRRFLTESVAWGRLLGRPRGPRPFTGRFELAVEVVPAFVMRQSETVLGAGVTPLFLRWNLTPGKRLQGFAELAGGLLRSDREIPERTTRLNFTAHAGFGVRIAVAARRAVLVGYRLHHISNGGRARVNPAVNSHTVFAGLAFLR